MTSSSGYAATRPEFLAVQRRFNPGQTGCRRVDPPRQLWPVKCPLSLPTQCVQRRIWGTRRALASSGRDHTMATSSNRAGSASDRDLLRTAALAVGAVFLLVGILGFIPGITTHYGDLTVA